MSEAIGAPFGRSTGSASSGTVHEAYSFACLSCGHGWEQSYEIAHHTDEDGRTTVTYFVGRERVPSPLTRPTCRNCGDHRVRIMSSGRVSSVGSRGWEQRLGGAAPAADPFSVLGGWQSPYEERAEREEAEGESEQEPSRRRGRRSWAARLLSAVLRLFRRHRDEDRAA